MTTKIERMDPELADLAKECGSKIAYYSGSWWLDSYNVQLIYNTDVTGGREVTLDWPGKLALAKQIIRKILAARAQPAWGTLADRINRVCDGLLTVDMLPRHFCYWRDETMDQGVLFASGLGGQGVHADIDLVGGWKFSHKAMTQDVAVEELRALALQRATLEA